MVFSSLIFLLFLFAALVVISYFCRDMRKKNLALLVFSLLFFAWGGIASVLLLAAVAAVNWFGAIRLAEQRDKGGRRLWLLGTVAADVLVFCLFRFWRLMPWAGAEAGEARYLMPMGLAFYTLRLIAYVVDVYRERAGAQRTYWKVLLYAGLFCYGAGGPLAPYGDVSRELVSRRTRSGEVSRGIMRFSCGLAKKVVLADSCKAAAEAIFGGSADTVAAAPVLGVWLGGIFFMLQIFLDLSAYADMAIGMGLVLGFHFPENFDYPYVSATLRDFWHRWNITVAGFFKEYVYIPLGGSAQGGAVALLNLAITWLAFGLWHGSYPNYLIWAGYCLALLLAEKLMGERLLRLPRAVPHIWVLLTMFLGFFLFRFTDLGMLATALKGLIGLNHAGFVNGEVGSLFLHHIPLLLGAGIAATPLCRLASAVWGNLAAESRGWFYARQVWNVLCPPLLLALSAAALVGDGVQSFLYFQI